MTQTHSIGEKIERTAKVMGALVAICGAVMAASSWAFSMAMASRDRQLAELSRDVAKIQQTLESSSNVSSDKIDQISEDITNLRIAIIAARAEVDMRNVTPSSVTSPRNQRRPAGAGGRYLAQVGSQLNGLSDLGRVDNILMDRESEYVASEIGTSNFSPALEPVVTVGNETVLIDNVETARQVFNEAIEQVTTNDPAVVDTGSQ